MAHGLESAPFNCGQFSVSIPGMCSTGLRWASIQYEQRADGIHFQFHHGTVAGAIRFTQIYQYTESPIQILLVYCHGSLRHSKPVGTTAWEFQMQKGKLWTYRTYPFGLIFFQRSHWVDNSNTVLSSQWQRPSVSPDALTVCCFHMHL